MFPESHSFYSLTESEVENPIELTHSLSPLASSLNAAITTLLVVLELSDITALVFPIKNRLNPHRLHILIDRQTVL